MKSNKIKNNFRGDYIANVYDHIAYRYEIIRKIALGEYGYILKVFDHKRSVYASLKVVRNRRLLHKLAMKEIEMLKEIREEECHSLIKLRDYFIFRDHVVKLV
jgi:dual specificity tyrosine-phosphorylation-regulated kinase 2/3/4